MQEARRPIVPTCRQVAIDRRVKKRSQSHVRQDASAFLGRWPLRTVFLRQTQYGNGYAWVDARGSDELGIQSQQEASISRDLCEGLTQHEACFKRRSAEPASFSLTVGLAADATIPSGDLTEK